LPRQRSPFGSASTRRHREVLNLGAAFFAIFLITRFVAWWWEWMPKYLFFFLVRAIALGLLTAFRRLRACGSRRMKHVALLAAGAVVIASNAVALIGVALNRSGVTQEIDLTERELTIDKLGEDNSGVSLHLRCVNSVPSDGPGWLGADKLAEPGFDVRTPVTDHSAGTRYRAVLPRDAFVVLELRGATWEAWVKKQEETAQRFSNDPRGASWARSGTRLIAVDAGRHPAALRRRYPDQARYLIVRATIRLARQPRWDPQAKRFTPPDFLLGYIQQVTPDEIHLPLPYATAISGAKNNTYVVSLRYGNRYEPWIGAVRTM